MISRFHYITQEIKGKTHWQLAEEACKGGVDWVQLRVKGKEYQEWKYTAQKTQEICRKYNAKFIINDNVELAKEISADGIHLGKTDVKPSLAKKILGENFIIGGTANTFEDILFLLSEKVDYIGLGPFRYTSTKENISPVIGIEGYEKIMNNCKKENIIIPIIAIGGIKKEDISQLMETGIYGIAVASVINRAENICASAKEIIFTIKQNTK